MLKKYIVEMDDSLAKVLHNSGSLRIVEYKDLRMTRTDALKKDTDFYCEEHDGEYCVFGDETGFCYYTGNKAHCEVQCKALKAHRNKRKGS